MAPVPKIGGLLLCFEKYSKFLFLLLVLISNLYSQTTEQVLQTLINEWNQTSYLPTDYMSSSYSPNSINSFELKTDSISFWEEDWDSIHIIKKHHILYPLLTSAYAAVGLKNPPKKIFLPALQLSLDSTYANDFEYQDSIEQKILLENYSDLYTNLESANLQISKMKPAYSNASRLAQKFAIYLTEQNEFDFTQYLSTYTSKLARAYITYSVVPNLDIFMISSASNVNYIISFSNFIYDISSDLSDSLDYSSYWKTTISSQKQALFYSSKTTNSILESAQEKADELEKMGINSHLYNSDARQNYLEYKNFISLAYKSIKQKEGCQNTDSLAKKYACAYISLEQFSSISQNPPNLPIFNRNNANLSLTYNTLSSPNSDSLLYGAVQFNTNLQNSINIFNQELQTSESQALSTQKQAHALLEQISQNDPQLFDDYDNFDKTPSKNLIATSEFGTISQLNEKSLNYSQFALSEFNIAKSTQKKRMQNYAALAIYHYKNSSSLYKKSFDSAKELNSSMHQKANSACASAQSQIITLQSKIDSSSSNEYSQSASLDSAIDFLNSAKEKLSESHKSVSLGKTYISCKESISLTELGLEIIQNPQEFSKNKTIDDALQKFNSLISAAKTLNYELADDYSKKYDELKSRYDSGLFVDLFEINSQSASLHRELDFLLSEHTIKFNSILENAQAMSLQNPKILSDFEKNMQPYRKNNLWSLQALQNSKILSSVLEKLKKETNSKSIEALNAYVCNNAQFTPSTYLATAGSRFDTGGIYAIQNPFNLTLREQFNLNCPFQIPFSNDEITQKSQNINSAYSQGDKVEISLNSLSPKQDISFRFSSTKIAISQTQKSCEAKIKEDGELQLISQYSLKSQYYPESLQITIPWPTHSSGAAKLITNDGQLIDGKFSSSQSSNPQIQFIIPQFSKTTDSFTLKIIPNERYSLTKLNYATNLSDSQNKISVSYYLSLQNLPQCHFIDLTIPEYTNSQIDDLQISADYAKLSSPKLNYVGQTKWFSTLSEIPQNGSVLISVQYNSLNADLWFNSTVQNLKIKANELQDLQSLTMLESAKSAYNSNRIEDAYNLISQVQKRISQQLPDNAKSRIEFEEELNFAQEKLSIIKSLNPALFQESADWQKDLQDAIEKSQNLWTEGSLQDARKTLRMQVAKLDEKASKEASELFLTLKEDSLLLNKVSTSLSKPPELQEYSKSLNSAQTSIENSTPLHSLLALQDARKSINLNIVRSLNSTNLALLAQDSQKQTLQADANSLSLDYDKYLQWLSELNSAKHLSMPPMSTKEAKSIQSSLNRLFSGYDDKSPKDLKSAIEKYTQNQLILDSVQSQILDYQIRLEQSFADFKSLAEHMHQTAKLSVQRLEDKNPQSKTLQTLNDDLNSVQKMFESQNYADAISLCESIIKRAGSQTPKTQPQLPIEILVLTALLIIIIAGYTLIQKSPPKDSPKEPSGPQKTLQKV